MADGGGGGEGEGLGVEGEVLAIGRDGEAAGFEGGEIVSEGGDGDIFGDDAAGHGEGVEGVVGDGVVVGFVLMGGGVKDGVEGGGPGVFGDAVTACCELAGGVLGGVRFGQGDEEQLGDLGVVEVAFAVEAVGGLVDDADVGDVGVVAGGAGFEHRFALGFFGVAGERGGDGEGSAVGRPLGGAGAFFEAGKLDDGGFGVWCW